MPDFEHPMMPREIADAPDIDNVPAASSMHALMGAVVEMNAEIRRVANHLGVPVPVPAEDEHTDLGDRVRVLYDTDPDRDVYETLALEVDGLYRHALREQDAALERSISVYRVGLFSDLWFAWADLRRGPRDRKWWRIKNRLRQVARSWRRRSYWNGFLAEVNYPPAGLKHLTCGRGWTRRAAARDLGLKLWKDNAR